MQVPTLNYVKRCAKKNVGARPIVELFPMDTVVSINMKEIDTFDQQGYVIVKNLLSQFDIEKLARIVDRIYAQWLSENRADFIEHRLVNMHTLTDSRYFVGRKAERLLFFQAIASNKLTQLIDNMFGDGIYFHNTQLFFNPFENKKLPYWHRDMQYSPIDDAILKNEQQNMVSLHVRIPLIQEQGIELIPGTHKRWDTELERDVRLELNGRKNSEDLPDSVLIELTPGDALIFSAQMIHRGNYRLNESRKSLDLCIGKYHPLTSVYINKNALPDIAELDKIENNRWFRVACGLMADNKM